MTRESELLGHFGLKRNGGNRDRIKRARKRLAQKGFSPEHDYTHVVPDGFKVKGVSTYYNEEGKPAGQWVKSTADTERQSEILRAIFDGMVDSIPRVSATAPPKGKPDDLLNFFSLWDFHLCALAWHEETGNDWDTDIAEQLLYDWLAAAIKLAPAASTALFTAGGDFSHWDSMNPITPEHGNLLDADSRFSLMMRVLIRVARRVVKELAASHETLYIKWISGNHDPAVAASTREWLSAMYEDEPRIIVDTSPKLYSCHEHGLTSLFFHHGHKRGVKTVDSSLAAEFREVWGRTKYSYAHVGHRHAQELLETNLMMVEQHGTLAGRDAYAAGGGWNSQRAAKVITYSAEYGEVGRVTITPEMVRGRDVEVDESVPGKPVIKIRTRK